MSKRIRALVRKYHGWLERCADGDWVAYFPSVWHREQFEREAGL